MDVPTQTHLAALRDLLVYRQRELAGEVHAADRMRKEAAAAVQATDTTTRSEGAARLAVEEVDAAQELRDRAELSEVEAALERLDHGVYGDCENCGESIPLQRLRVQPAATRCAACQADFEHRPRERRTDG